MPAVPTQTGRLTATGLAALVLVLIVGAGLRLVWPADMEYKADEIYSFERSQRVGVSEPWPWTGMNNSADVPHPGLSVWVFAGLAAITGADDPTKLNLACMALNAIALGMLVVFVANAIPANEREPWWWGIALVAVNPLAVVFHRKIWPPSIMPAITVLLLMAWWHRDRQPWAFVWGFVAILAAQVHPGAFFFSAGMALWALAFDRSGVRWRWAILGGALASLPALPWLYHLLFVAERSAAAKAHWWRPFEFKFWNYWFTEPFGLGLGYSLGADFRDFLRWPMIGGSPTYGVAVLHGLLAVGMAMVLGRWVWHCVKTKNPPHPPFARREISQNARDRTAFTIAAVMIGYGGVLTLTGLPVYRHYMIVTFPLMFVAVARAAFSLWTLAGARRILSGLCVTQAALTALFLSYIHAADRPIRGDYGTPYRVQLSNAKPNESLAAVCERDSR